MHIQTTNTISNQLYAVSIFSKPALTEAVEIDQYIWAILNTLSSTSIEEVIIDSDANWKSVQDIGVANIKVRSIILTFFQFNFVLPKTKY